MEVFSKSAGVTMALYNTWATISLSTRDPASSSTLQTGWVQLHNVPDWARNVEAVTLIGELAGNVVVVDELSLIKEDAIRVKLQARENDKIRGFVEVFIEKVGYEIRFVPMKPMKAQISGPPPAPPRQEDEGSEDDEDLLGSEDDQPRGRRGDSGSTCPSGQKYSGGSSIGKQSTESLNQNMSTGTLGMVAGITRGSNTKAKPIAGYDPTSGL